MNRNEDGHVSDDIQVIKNIVNSDLNETTKNKTIKKMMNNNEGDDGFMDKIFGKKHPDIYVTMVICLLLVIVGITCTVLFQKNIEFVKYIWGIIIPAITLGVGYIFGVNKE